MRKRVLVLAGTLVIAMWLGLQVSEAPRFRARVLSDARASQLVSFKTPSGDIERKTWAEYVLVDAARNQTNAVNYWLINRPAPIIWAIIYALAGLAGGCIYLLLLVVEPAAAGRDAEVISQAFESIRILVRLIVAATAGALSFLVAILPAKALAAIQITGLDPTSDSTSYYGSLLLLPAVGGIFISTFFPRLRMWLERVLPERKAASSPPAQQDGGGK